MTTGHHLAVSLALSIICCTGVSHAEARSAASDCDTVTVSLDQISVTAIKQSASLLRQPVAVTTVNLSEIERLNINGIKSVSEIAPNFYMPDYGSKMTSSIYVRGIGARIDQPAVGLNIDNIPYLNKNGFDLDMIDIDRIEVLRGPQSTLYGRNTIAGLINVYTISPLAWQGVRAMAEGSTPGGWKVGAGIYDTVTDDLGMSLSFYGSGNRGYVRNRHNGQWDGNTGDMSGRWRTQWRPSDRWILENTFSGGYSCQHGYPYAYSETGQVNYNDTCFYKRKSLTEGLTARWTGDNVTISSITGLQLLDDNMTLDQDFLPLSYFTLTQRQIERSITQDIVASGSAGKYSWLAGLFGFYKHNRMQAPVTFKQDGIESLINSNLPPGMSLDWEDGSFVLGDDFRAPVKGLAIYHRSTFTAGKWIFSAALRFDYEHTTLLYHSHLNTSATMNRQMAPGVMVPIATRDIVIDDRGKLHDSFKELLPNFSVTYNMRSSAIFASVSKGYKAGGFNTQMFSNVLQARMESMFNPSASGEAPDVDATVSYRPESSWNYEIGGHFTCDGGRVYSTFSAFYIDVRDQQVTVFPDGVSTGRMMTNAARSRSAGAELSLRYAPTSRWRFDLSYGFTDARFRHFNDGKDDHSGRHVPYAPSNTLFVSALYRLPIGSGSSKCITFNPTVRGVGSIYWDEANTSKQPFYAESGLTVGLDCGHFKVELWGRNLTDTDYKVFRYESIGNAFFQRGRGAHGGITLRVSM